MDKNPQQESDAWKKKYLLNIEQSEKKERQLKNIITQLRYGLSRISVAADGLDPGLDRQLLALRKEIRSRINSSAIRKHIETISKTLIDLDEIMKLVKCALFGATML